MLAGLWGQGQRLAGPKGAGMGAGKQDEGARGLCDLETAGRPGQEGRSNLLHWQVSLAVPVQKETRLRALTSPRKPSAESNGKRVILSDIVGRVSSGQMLALMGPSGAGKSSLLDCISLRNRRFTGMVYLNGKPAGDDFLSTTGEACATGGVRLCVHRDV